MQEWERSGVSRDATGGVKIRKVMENFTHSHMRYQNVTVKRYKNTDLPHSPPNCVGSFTLGSCTVNRDFNKNTKSGISPLISIAQG